ncbi:MAG: response regulator [Proteobacteria bacterium]|nr:response regulator [Pseudomonadota bacterium]MBU1738488.1 response regulator [Pseudomonadota bacterium]
MTGAEEHILFVDDERNILKAVARLLDDTPYRLLVAANGVEALDLVKNNIVSVVVSDNIMPGMLGVELLARIRTLSPDTIRILLTGQADLHTAIDAINHGEVFRFLLKPWDNHELLAVLREASDRFALVNKLRRSDEATLLSLAQTVELKDAYTRGHCDNVAKYSLMIAEELGLADEVVENIRHGSWLHDIGKIGVPESILNKNGPLTEEEFAVVRHHPRWGADVARQARLHHTVIDIILYHHEKFGGGGYPTGISGEEIPLEARIVGVADVFDALTTDRPYREAYSIEKACGILNDMRGSSLEPRLVEILIGKVGA